MKVFVRYVLAKAYRGLVEYGYRVYVTESLRLIPQMSYLTERWVDFNTRDKGSHDERTAEDIVASVIAKMGADDEPA